MRVSILGNSSVFCIFTFSKAYAFCYFVVFLWRTKSRLVNWVLSLYHRNISKRPEIVSICRKCLSCPFHSLRVFWCFAQLPWMWCVICNNEFWITIFSVQFIMICTENRRLTHSQIELRHSTNLFGRILVFFVFWRIIGSLFCWSARVTGFFFQRIAKAF